MSKNVMSLLAVASIFVAVSCKKNEHIETTTLDSNNMVVSKDMSLANELLPKVKMNPGEYPKIEIENANFDFGKINEGDKVEHVFTFKNTGKSDLIIMNAKASCGCTVPDWTKTPVKSGESGEVKIIFNSAGKPGEQHKTILLTTNTELGNERMEFKASVTPNPNSPLNKK